MKQGFRRYIEWVMLETAKEAAYLVGTVVDGCPSSRVATRSMDICRVGENDGVVGQHHPIGSGRLHNHYCGLECEIRQLQYMSWI